MLLLVIAGPVHASEETSCISPTELFVMANGMDEIREGSK